MTLTHLLLFASFLVLGTYSGCASSKSSQCDADEAQGSHVAASSTAVTSPLLSQRMEMIFLNLVPAEEQEDCKARCRVKVTYLVENEVLKFTQHKCNLGWTYFALHHRQEDWPENLVAKLKANKHQKGKSSSLDDPLSHCEIMPETKYASVVDTLTSSFTYFSSPSWGTASSSWDAASSSSQASRWGGASLAKTFRDVLLKAEQAFRGARKDCSKSTRPAKTCFCEMGLVFEDVLADDSTCDPEQFAESIKKEFFQFGFGIIKALQDRAADIGDRRQFSKLASAEEIEATASDELFVRGQGPFEMLLASVYDTDESRPVNTDPTRMVGLDRVRWTEEGRKISLGYKTLPSSSKVPGEYS